jgi:hypothetical protein
MRILILFSVLLFTGCLLAADPSPADASPPRDAITRGLQFLENLYDPQAGLLPEYRGSPVYWLYHDNYLAAKMLSGTRPDLAREIENTLRKYAVTNSGKIEILFGEARKGLPFRHYNLTNVARLGDKTIRTEVVTTNLMTGWEEYADLLLLAAIAEAKDNPAQARAHLDKAESQWDGKGFKDRASEHLKLYATYKLALYLIAQKRLGATTNISEAVKSQLLAMQGKEGGWITDYDFDMRPRGLANVETTCMALLALQASR